MLPKVAKVVTRSPEGVKPCTLSGSIAQKSRANAKAPETPTTPLFRPPAIRGVRF
jgi:hypothetical protein